ncbi:helix-turn-helix domain-containing protein [Hymenobacter actinosclerus]|nr:helix-turn-helix domain-containing protein [Hymenobacter actinosclerus]
MVEDLLLIPEVAWQKARQRLDVLRPILEGGGGRALVEEVAEQQQVSAATLYRWLQAYRETGSVRSLVERPRSGGKKERLDAVRDAIVRQAIEEHYLTQQRKPASAVILEVRGQCLKQGLKPPGPNTIRRRIRQLSEEETTRRRWGRRIAAAKFTPLKGEFPGADFPLAVVQIDHTLVDIILVDEEHRRPIGRPNITVATDVFSRMVVGFYLSFDPPGAVGTGLCLAHAVLPKEMWLSRMDVQGDWPCWGVPRVINADNAKEFRGHMIHRAAEEYGMRLEWRPVKKPHWSGHVERLIKTFMKKIHTLRGTTFSNVQERKEYESEKEAVLTLRELEKWLTVFIVNVYHRRMHHALHQSPYDRYHEGIMGSLRFVGTGLPERIYNESQVRLDFMPGEYRTIQEYGVVMDHVHYDADVLRPHIHSLEPGPGKTRLKRKFLFKRDPRNISCLYFLEPETKQYHRIPYRDTSLPAISVWEFRQALDSVKAAGRENIDEQAIFEAYDKMRAIEMEALARTRKTNKQRNRMAQGVPDGTTGTYGRHGATVGSTAAVINPSSDEKRPTPIPQQSPAKPLPRLTPLQPFDGIYDASFAPERSETTDAPRPPTPTVPVHL